MLKAEQQNEVAV